MNAASQRCVRSAAMSTPPPPADEMSMLAIEDLGDFFNEQFLPSSLDDGTWQGCNLGYDHLSANLQLSPSGTGITSQQHLTVHKEKGTDMSLPLIPSNGLRSVEQVPYESTASRTVKDLKR